ncbi:MAG: divalent-cation tolerance protein CutA, partial [Actinomycetia bacterium]|nr:divalent-cation tolerance protein CutA [Actinomycetes bacterium]
MEKDVRLILTTEVDLEAARRLATKLLEGKIVACVTMTPVRSMYRWRGEIEDADEVQVLLKTTNE